MKKGEIDQILRATLEDGRLSRGERDALRQALADGDVHPEELAFVRHRAFALARERLSSHADREVLDWLEDALKALRPAAPSAEEGSRVAEVHVSPGPACLRAILRQVEGCRERMDICVFTITDDRLVEPILAAHRRGVSARVITDDDKSGDLGSDVGRLARAGIPVRRDRSEHHMHHKFALFDGRIVLTGSYNWTRSAAEHNEENLLVTDDRRFVEPYREIFERVWAELE